MACRAAPSIGGSLPTLAAKGSTTAARVAETASTWRTSRSIGAELVGCYRRASFAPEGIVIKLLVADVDGTLVTQAKALTARARDAVRRLHDAGVSFAITSGRP